MTDDTGYHKTDGYGLDTYIMTLEQTALYERNDHAAIDNLHRAIDAELSEAGAEEVEIYTADGIVAWMYDAR